MNQKGISMNTYNMFVFVILALFLVGCASSSGGNQSTRNTSTAMSNKEQKCNAGEILVCKARESHRISDGRYGRNSRKNQKCSCQPETDLSDMGMDVIGNGQ